MWKRREILMIVIAGLVTKGGGYAHSAVEKLQDLDVPQSGSSVLGIRAVADSNAQNRKRACVANLLRNEHHGGSSLAMNLTTGLVQYFDAASS